MVEYMTYHSGIVQLVCELTKCLKNKWMKLCSKKQKYIQAVERAGDEMLKKAENKQR
jgi:hypothetical protein